MANPARSVRRATRITFGVIGSANGGNRYRGRNRRGKGRRTNWGGILFWLAVIIVIIAAFGGH